MSKFQVNIIKNGAPQGQTTPVTKGSSTVIKAQPGERYELQDVSGPEKVAPKTVKLSRKGKNLQVFLDGEETASLIIDDYYDVFPEGYNALIGQGEAGTYYEYIAQTGDVSALTADAGAVDAALGATEVLPSGGALGVAVLPQAFSAAGLGGVAAVAAAAAGGGGTAAPAVHNLILKGTVTAGPVTGGVTIKAYDKDGTLLGTTQTQADGTWTITVVNSAYKGAVLVVAEDANGAVENYLDEVSGDGKSLDNGTVATKLRAVGIVTAAAADANEDVVITLNITPVTELAARKINLAVNKAPSTDAEVTEANNAVAAELGVANLDIVGIKPITTNSAQFVAVGGELTDGEKYGLLLAKLSGLDAVRGGLANSLDALAGATAAETVELLDIGRQEALAGRDYAFNQSPIEDLKARKLLGDVTAMTSAEVASLGTEIANFGSATISALTSSQVSALTSAQAASLGSEDVAALSSDAVGGLSSAQVEAMTSTALSGLTSSQVAALSTDAFTGLSTADLGQLSSAAVAGITGEQVDGLSSEEIQALGTDIANLGSAALASLTSEQVAALTTDQIAALSSEDVAALSTAGISGLTSGQVAALSTDAFSALSTDDLGALTSAAVAGITSGQVGTLTSEEIQALGTDIATLGSSAMGTLTSGQVDAMGSDQVGALGSEDLSAMSTDGFTGLSSADLGTLTSAAVAGITSGQVGTLTSEEIQALGTDIANLGSAALGALTSEQVAALTTDQIAALSSEDIASLTSEALTGLNSAQVGALTTDGFSGLSTADLGALTSAAVAGITSAQIGTLDSAEVQALGTDIANMGSSVLFYFEN